MLHLQSYSFRDLLFLPQKTFNNNIIAGTEPSIKLLLYHKIRHVHRSPRIPSHPIQETYNISILYKTQTHPHDLLRESREFKNSLFQGLGQGSREPLESGRKLAHFLPRIGILDPHQLDGRGREGETNHYVDCA